MIFPENGILLEKDVFDEKDCEALREGYFEAEKICSELQKKYGIYENTRNTVHHTLFLNNIFLNIFENENYLKPVSSFFENKKFIINSLGGNNNVGKVTYANNIHRDVRFFSRDKLMLNTIICVTGFDEFNGATEFLPNSSNLEQVPDKSYFDKNAVSFTCSPGSVIYFDSRIWHRAGTPKKELTERIIFTPIFSRPFIKQGFDYASKISQMGVENFSDNVVQISGYRSAVPQNHDEWYDIKNRRFYQADQDI